MTDANINLKSVDLDLESMRQFAVTPKEGLQPVPLQHFYEQNYAQNKLIRQYMTKVDKTYTRWLDTQPPRV